MLSDDASPSLESAVARTRRLLALLCELREMGMDLVRVLHRQAMNGGELLDAAQRYCQLAKAIRQLIALEARLAQALSDVHSGRWAQDEAERELRALTTQARKDAAFEVVEQAIRNAGDGEAFERLSERLDDWYAEHSAERDFHDKSVAEIVIGACKLIGLAPDPSLLTDEAISQTLADAVRAYAAALNVSRQGRTPSRSVDSSPPPSTRRPNAIADPRPPPA